MHRRAKQILDQFADAEGGLTSDEFDALLKQTGKPVPWAYDVWDVMVAGLTDQDNHRRSIAAQVLCNLALSDPKKRILKDLDALMVVTHDARFVTARHSLSALWRIGLAGKKQRAVVVDRLAKRFAEAADEKNGTLIRYDIAVSLRNLFDAVQDESIKTTALALIATETDEKYRKKYATAWRGA